jgi:hypothetical protein
LLRRSLGRIIVQESDASGEAPVMSELQTFVVFAGSDNRWLLSNSTLH